MTDSSLRALPVMAWLLLIGGLIGSAACAWMAIDYWHLVHNYLQAYPDQAVKIANDLSWHAYVPYALPALSCLLVALTGYLRLRQN